jgi:hypothetical protein
MVDRDEVFGLEQSMIASGYPMQSECLTIDEYEEAHNDLFFDLHKNDPNVENKHFKRAIKLGNTPNGSGHSNFLKGIIVQADLTCSQAMHMQILRYNFFDVISSQSKMHKLLKMDINKSVNDYVQSETVDILEGLIILYNEDPSKENYLKVIYNCPIGLELTFRFNTNYLQLKTIYNQRHNHRLPEWREFCSWIKRLPYFTELTGIDNQHKTLQERIDEFEANKEV